MRICLAEYLQKTSFLWAIRPEEAFLWAREEKRNHLMECRICGQPFDMRDLGEVLKHEHEGLTEDLDVDGLGPGKRIG